MTVISKVKDQRTEAVKIEEGTKAAKDGASTKL